jgi:DNA-binding NarL/FixJ family response regulator
VLYRREIADISPVILELIIPNTRRKHCLEELLEVDPKVRVLVVNGHAANGPTQDSIDAGAMGFISKSYDAAEVTGAIRKPLDEP